MKPVRFILALYIAALTVFPCSDPDTCKDELQLEGLVANISDHQHSQHEMDVCTPFCICSCCAAHIRLSPVPDLNLAHIIHNTRPAVPYLERRVISNHNRIWQPPRM